MEETEIIEAAEAVLKLNDRTAFTIPAEGLYPHQWLWDSCFIAIGIRHYDTERAKTEVLNMLQAQWSNGMIPHMLINSGFKYRNDRQLWRSYVSEFAPDDVATSGITQPPMLAEAIVQIGKKLPLPERRSWYERVFQSVVHYHQWLYTERDPRNIGLTLQLHSWETGLDSTPPWMHELHQHQMPVWIRLVEKLKLYKIITLLRRDIHYVPPGQRLSTIDALGLYSIQRRLRRKQYNTDKILSHSMLAIEDLAFNCILIRANTQLQQIAKTLNKLIPPDLQENMARSEKALEELWDAYSGQYYSRNYSTHKLIKIPSIATLLPLYAGCVSKDRAEQLVSHMKSSKRFWPKFPVPSVPIESEWFDEHRYWQGSTWLNTNWLVADGLERYGYKDEAKHIRTQSIELITKSGFNEYFSPLDGSPAGAQNFSWTAALAIDFIKHKR